MLKVNIIILTIIIFSFCNIYKAGFIYNKVDLFYAFLFGFPVEYNLNSKKDSYSFVESKTILLNELNKYPKFKISNLKFILAKKSLLFNISGRHFKFFQSSTIGLFGQVDARLVHHEVFHALSESPVFDKYIKKWPTSNAARKLAKVSLNRNLSNNYPGFLSDYSRSSKKEDLAEFYSCYMVKECHFYIDRLAVNSIVIKKKLSLIESIAEELLND